MSEPGFQGNIGYNKGKSARMDGFRLEYAQKLHIKSWRKKHKSGYGPWCHGFSPPFLPALVFDAQRPRLAKPPIQPKRYEQYGLNFINMLDGN
jgi:hypothetical protein